MIALDGSPYEVDSTVDHVVKNLRRSNGRVLSPSQRILAKQQLKRRHNSVEFAKQLNERIPDSFCALCLSEENTLNPMWSHYADNHRGVCIGFKLGELKSNFEHFFRIKYQDTRPDVSIFDANDPLKFLSAFNTKHTDWSYEKEVRVVNLHSARSVPFNKNLIASIYLGSDISEDNKNFVIRLIKKHMPHVKIVLSKRDELNLSISFEQNEL